MSNLLLEAELDLGTILTQLEAAAVTNNIKTLQWLTNDEIISRCGIEKFKHSARKVLTEIEIILVLHPPT